MELKIRRLSDNKIFTVWKYINTDEEISVWCRDWYGRHIIGADCEFYKPDSND